MTSRILDFNRDDLKTDFADTDEAPIQPALFEARHLTPIPHDHLGNRVEWEGNWLTVDGAAL